MGYNAPPNKSNKYVSYYECKKWINENYPLIKKWNPIINKLPDLEISYVCTKHKKPNLDFLSNFQYTQDWKKLIASKTNNRLSLRPKPGCLRRSILDPNCSCPALQQQPLSSYS